MAEVVGCQCLRNQQQRRYSAYVDVVLYIMSLHVGTLCNGANMSVYKSHMHTRYEALEIRTFQGNSHYPSDPMFCAFNIHRIKFNTLAALYII